MMVVIRRAPLWPAGHLPLKGGDQSSRRHANACSVAERTDRPGALLYLLTSGRGRGDRLISPLEGEMAGRPEGGDVEHRSHPMAATKARSL
ncbi:hypothetical protein ASC75_13780 [Aminobacter sp. DSM 101952]|nr:hypothetical protein ASC75_13780 [Aminobacter sp. DSM 101952]